MPNVSPTANAAGMTALLPRCSCRRSRRTEQAPVHNGCFNRATEHIRSDNCRDPLATTIGTSELQRLASWRQARIQKPWLPMCRGHDISSLVRPDPQLIALHVCRDPTNYRSVLPLSSFHPNHPVPLPSRSFVQSGICEVAGMARSAPGAFACPLRRILLLAKSLRWRKESGGRRFCLADKRHTSCVPPERF
jgi:hypothetical protein